LTKKRNHRSLLFAFALSVALAHASESVLQTTQLDYQPAHSETIENVYFGTRVPDPYRWLENDKSPEVRAWVKSQDLVARKYLSSLPGRETLVQRFKTLYYRHSISIPEKDGQRLFYTECSPNEEKAILYYLEGNDQQKHIILDPNQMSAKGNISLGDWVPSRDGTKLAYTIRKDNSDKAILHVLDVASGLENPLDVIQGADYASVAWMPGHQSFYYTWLPTDPQIPESDRLAYSDIRLHRLGTDPKTDRIIYPSTKDPELVLSASLSRDGRWLFITTYHGWSKTDVSVQDLESPSPEFKSLFTGIDAAATVIAWKNRFFIQTNYNAPRYKIIEVSPDQTDTRHWKTIVPERQNTVINSMSIIGNHLVLIFLENASSQVEIRSLEGRLLRKLPLSPLRKYTGYPCQKDHSYYGEKKTHRWILPLIRWSRYGIRQRTALRSPCLS
jgi:prolyl oligopeptidase